MKAAEKSNKDVIKLRFATALSKALEKSSIDSWKKLAKEAGMEPSHMQKISVGKLDITLTTIQAISAALSLSFHELAYINDQVTEKEIQEYREKLEAQKKHKGKAKLPLKSKKISPSKRTKGQ